jgi:hypothetical protein
MGVECAFLASPHERGKEFGWEICLRKNWGSRMKAETFKKVAI